MAGTLLGGRIAEAHGPQGVLTVLCFVPPVALLLGLLLPEPELPEPGLPEPGLPEPDRA